MKQHTAIISLGGTTSDMYSPTANGLSRKDIQEQGPNLLVVLPSKTTMGHRVMNSPVTFPQILVVMPHMPTGAEAGACQLRKNSVISPPNATCNGALNISIWWRVKTLLPGLKAMTLRKGKQEADPRGSASRMFMLAVNYSQSVTSRTV